MLCPPVPTTEEALTTRLLHSTIHALEVFSIYLGKELGLYAALSSGARVTPPELAQATSIAPRYAREWLEQQAVAGLLRVESATEPADARRYWLPTEHVNVLVHQTTLRISHRWRKWSLVSAVSSVTSSRPTGLAAACRTPCSAPRYGRGRPASTGHCAHA